MLVFELIVDLDNLRRQLLVNLVSLLIRVTSQLDAQLVQISLDFAVQIVDLESDFADLECNELFQGRHIDFASGRCDLWHRHILRLKQFKTAFVICQHLLVLELVAIRLVSTGLQSLDSAKQVVQFIHGVSIKAWTFGVSSTCTNLCDLFFKCFNTIDRVIRG